MPSVLVSEEGIQVTAVKMAEEKNWLVIRLFEPTGEKRDGCVSVPALGLSFDVSLVGFEIKSMAVDLASHEVFEVNLMEEKI